MSEETEGLRAKIKVLEQHATGTKDINRLADLKEKLAKLEYRERHPNLIEQFFNFIEESI